MIDSMCAMHVMNQLLPVLLSAGFCLDPNSNKEREREREKEFALIRQLEEEEEGKHMAP